MFIGSVRQMAARLPGLPTEVRQPSIVRHVSQLGRNRFSETHFSVRTFTSKVTVDINKIRQKTHELLNRRLGQAIEGIPNFKKQVQDIVEGELSLVPTELDEVAIDNMIQEGVKATYESWINSIVDRIEGQYANDLEAFRGKIVAQKIRQLQENHLESVQQDLAKERGAPEENHIQAWINEINACQTPACHVSLSDNIDSCRAFFEALKYVKIERLRLEHWFTTNDQVAWAIPRLFKSVHSHPTLTHLTLSSRREANPFNLPCSFYTSKNLNKILQEFGERTCPIRFLTIEDYFLDDVLLDDALSKLASKLEGQNLVKLRSKLNPRELTLLYKDHLAAAPYRLGKYEGQGTWSEVRKRAEKHQKLADKLCQLYASANFVVTIKSARPLPGSERHEYAEPELD